MEKKLSELRVLDSHHFIEMMKSGMLNLRAHYQEVNDLNVFPVPDGDTGINMRRTIETGFDIISKELENKNIPLYKVAQDLSKGMLLGARGNSGVILSQIFRGFSYGLFQKTIVGTSGLSIAWRYAVKQAYGSVVKPVEGTILTVIKEATNYANRFLNVTIHDYFENFLKQAKITLEKTKEMLDVLKEADVIDSGGAGFTYIIEGFAKYFRGEVVENSDEPILASPYAPKDKDNTEEKQTSLDFSLFNENSVLDYGYCTEFILQLQSSKVDVNNFSEQTVIDYLKTQGDSIVCFKDGSLVKTHVHTKDPGAVLSHVRCWGEFLTVKVENMSLQHNNVLDHKAKIAVAPKKEEHKKYASVSVAQGDGICQAFLDLGVNRIVDGKQTMNPSTEDFINCFDTLDAENIFVLPNNSNIILTANQAANMYKETKPEVNVIVIPTKSIAQGYIAASMFTFDAEDVEQIRLDVESSFQNVNSLEVTFATRDTNMSGVQVKKDDYIGILNHELVADNKEKLGCLMDSIGKIDDVQNKELILLIYGKDVDEVERQLTKETVKKQYPSMEVGEIVGGQDIYSYIVAIS